MKESLCSNSLSNFKGKQGPLLISDFGETKHFIEYILQQFGLTFLEHI